jgi:hypothetical protein
MSCWILQSNPSEFRLVDWLRDFDWITDDRLIDCWDIESRGEEVQPGDTIFLEGGGVPEVPASIYAQGKVVKSPDVFTLADRKSQYFRKTTAMGWLTGPRRLAVKYVYLRLGDPPLTEEVGTRANVHLRATIGDSRSQIQRISDTAGSVIKTMLGEYKSMIELQNCRT